MKNPLPLLATALATLIPLAAADFEANNPDEFSKLFPAVKIEKLATDLRFTEGPVWVPSKSYLIFSDIPADQLKKWAPSTGLTTFREPSQNANGNTLDNTGRLITCEHGSRRVSITEEDGSVRTLVDSYDGKKLNSPNDAVVKSDGTVWFTDPDYGLRNRTKEVPGNYVYRFNPITKEITPVATDFDKPNGLCFSPNEKQLYIADSGKPRHIRVFDVQKDGSITNGRIFASIDQGAPDGIRCDREGRLFSSAGDGVHIFSADGELIGKILLPEAAANLCFGGEDYKTLFVTARTSLYAVPMALSALDPE